MHATTLREAWLPLEEYRTTYGARPYGQLYLGMNKDFRRLPMAVNNLAAVVLLHGDLPKSTKVDPKPTYRRGSNPSAKIWQARLWLPMNENTRRFHFYEGQQAVRLEPPGLLASAFVNVDARRVLLAVSNLDQEPVAGARVQLDWKGLGMDGMSRPHAEDAILGSPIDVDGDTLRIDIEPERYRLIKLWGE